MSSSRSMLTNESVKMDPFREATSEEVQKVRGGEGKPLIAEGSIGKVYV